MGYQICNCWCPILQVAPVTRRRLQYKRAGKQEKRKTDTEQEIEEETEPAVSGEEDLQEETEAAVSGEKDLHVEDSDFEFEEDIAIREINKVLGGDEDADSDYESDFEDEIENAKMIDKFSREFV